MDEFLNIVLPVEFDAKGSALESDVEQINALRDTLLGCTSHPSDLNVSIVERKGYYIRWLITSNEDDLADIEMFLDDENLRQPEECLP